MGQQAVPRFGNSIRETFSNSVTFAMINKGGNGADMQISTVLWPIYHGKLRYNYLKKKILSLTFFFAFLKSTLKFQ